MRVLMLTQFFAPEPNFKSLPLAQELVRRGHEVEVLTGFPNYPGGRLYPGYRLRLWQRETVQGIPVVRVPLYPSHDRSAARRALNYTTFACAASLLGPWLVRRPDVMYVYHPPGTIGLPALALRTRFGCPFVYDVQDLWPDTISSSGMMSNGRLLRLADGWCRTVYRSADHVVVLSPGFRDVLVERGVPPERIDILYNWADETQLQTTLRDESLAPQFGLTGRFNVVFAGTMGLAQGLDTVLQAAQISAAATPDVQFVLVGGGVERSRLEEKAARLGLSNVRFLPRQPPEAIGNLLALADVLLVHLRNDPLFRITIPQKTQAYLAMGRPILMAVPGDAADLVRQSGAGIVCPSENPVELAAAVRHLRDLTPAERDAMGAAGRRFYREHLSLHRGAGRFSQILETLVRNSRQQHASSSPGTSNETRKSSRRAA